MTTRSSDFNYVESEPGINAYKATADTYYKGQLIAMKPSTGLAILWSDVAEYEFLGITTGGIVSTAAITDMVRVDERGVILKKVTVTGASAVTDTGSPVWAGDDNTETAFTLTATVNAGAVGIITRWWSSTTCDVRLLTPEQYKARMASDHVSLQVEMDNIADGDIVSTWVPGFAGRIVDVDWIQGEPVTTASKLSTLNLEIGTTNVTGGTLSLTSATCTPLGIVVAGAAITAANHFTATDTISIEASSTTAFAEGDGMVVIHFVRD